MNRDRGPLYLGCPYKRSPQHRGRLPQQQAHPPGGVGTKQKSIFTRKSALWHTRNRPICLRGKTGKYSLFSLTREQGSKGVEALAQRWELDLAFPPLALIPRVLQKLSQSDCRLNRIAPWWPRRASFSTLKKWSVPPRNICQSDRIS